MPPFSVGGQNEPDDLKVIFSYSPKEKGYGHLNVGLRKDGPLFVPTAGTLGRVPFPTCLRTGVCRTRVEG